MNPPIHIHTPDTDLSPLLSTLSELIRHSRQKALRVVDTLQVQTCWNMGRHIIEHEQAGAARAEYGKQLLPTLAKALTAEFGKGFDERNLRHMRGFYQAFPIWNAVRTELSWTHYRTLLRVESGHARQWYMNEAATLNWSTRALERQIGTLYYERLLVSQDRPALKQEAAGNLAPLNKSPREFVRYSVLHGNEQLFASKYSLVLPTEDELRAELDREQALVEAGTCEP